MQVPSHSTTGTTRWIVAVLEHSLSHDVADSIKFCLTRNPVRGATVGVKSIRSAPRDVELALRNDVGLDCTDSRFPNIKCRGHLVVVQSALETLHVARIASASDSESRHPCVSLREIFVEGRAFSSEKTIPIQILRNDPVLPLFEWSSQSEIEVQEDSTALIQFDIQNSHSFPFELVVLSINTQHGTTTLGSTFKCTDCKTCKITSTEKVSCTHRP